MPSQGHRRLLLDLPPLTTAQADAVFQLLGELQGAFWGAYQDQLLDAASQHADDAQREAEALDPIAPLDPT